MLKKRTFLGLGNVGTISFYYGNQSPVTIVEFDHHSGGFLNSEESAELHLHTIVRTPNEGDYGYILRD
jgi:hypothetical protein